MSYQTITNSEVSTGAPVDANLFGKVKNNLDDHESRIALPPDVQESVLSSFVVGSNAAVINTDTVIRAFGKVQGQVNALATATASVEPAIPTGTTLQYIRGNKTLSSFSSDVNALQYWAKAPSSHTLTMPSNQGFARFGTALSSLGGGSVSGSNTIIAGWGGNTHSQEAVDTTDGINSVLNRFQFKTAKGTTTGLTGMLANEILADIVIAAHQGVTFSQVAKLEFKALENFTSGSQGTAVSLSTTKVGTFAASKVIELIGASTNTNGITLRVAGMSSGANTQDTYSLPSNDQKASLDVNGSVVTRTYTYANGSVFDLSKSNSMIVTAPTGSSFVLNNIQNGAAYTLAFQDSASIITPAFTYSKAEDGATTGLTFVYSPALSARTSGKHWVSSIVRLGTFVYLNWQEF